MTLKLSKAPSSCVPLDIARLALREDRRFDGDILEEVLAYCWDQLGWRRTYGEMETIRANLRLDGDERS